MSDDVKQVFSDAVKATKGLALLPYTDYAHRLHNKVRHEFTQDSNDHTLRTSLTVHPTIPQMTSIQRELGGWFSYIGKGLQTAFSGTSLWKWAGEAFDQAISKFHSLAGGNLLKGLSSIYMVATSLAMAAMNIWSLLSSWNSMSDAQKTDAIIEIMRMVTDSVDKAIDAFKSFKSGLPSTTADELQMEALNDSLIEEIAENADEFQKVAQDVAGGEDYRMTIADGLQYDGVATETDGEESWNEPTDTVPTDTPPGSEDAAKALNLSGNLLRVLNAILGVGLVVSMSFALAKNWNSLSDPGKVLGVLNVIVQGLTVMLDVVDVASDIGLFAVTAEMTAALSIFGGVLAVVGIVLMLVQVFINLFAPANPPADRLKISSTPWHTISSGEVATITITGQNKSSDDVTISNTKITLYSGDDDVCLFRNGANGTATIQLVTDNDPKKSNDGYTYDTPNTTTAAQLPTPASLGGDTTYYEYGLEVAGLPQDTSSKLQQLVLKAGEAFNSVWTGEINDKGKSDDTSISWIDVVENGLYDRCHAQFSLLRV
ncbi:hypothetical protein BJX76DRAFT_354842 [Aspergillus varians]